MGEKIFVTRGRSDWKSQGSDIKMKSGFCSLQIERRSLDTRLNPSQFQVKHLKLCNIFTDASEDESELSEDISLNLCEQKILVDHHWLLHSQVYRKDLDGQCYLWTPLDGQDHQVGKMFPQC